VGRIVATIALLTILATAATVWAAGLAVNGGTLQGFAVAVRQSPTSATVDITPDSLQKRSQGSDVTAYIELPADFDVANIDTGTVQLCREGVGCVPARPHPTGVDDYDNDGIPDRMVKFDRDAVIDLVTDVTAPDTVTFTVSGIVNLPGRAFAGSDTVRLVDPDDEPTMATSDTTITDTATGSPSTTATPTSSTTPTSADASQPTWMIRPERESTATGTSTPTWMIGPEREAIGTSTPTWMIGPETTPRPEPPASEPSPEPPMPTPEPTATATPTTEPTAISGDSG
jgi:hypothetical protein